MEYLKKKLLLEEFGLESWGTEWDSIQVKRLDESLLKSSFINASYDGSYGCGSEVEEVYIDFGDGLEKIEDIKPHLIEHSNYAHSSNIDEEGETLLEWMIRNEKLTMPKLVVITYERHSHWGMSTDGDDYKLNIYKPAKYENLIGDYLEETKKRIAAEIAAEISF